MDQETDSAYVLSVFHILNRKAVRNIGRYMIAGSLEVPNDQKKSCLYALVLPVPGKFFCRRISYEYGERDPAYGGRDI